MQETRDTHISIQTQVDVCATIHYTCADADIHSKWLYTLTYTVITIFYVFVLISETLASLYDACDLTYFSTTVPRTLESKCAKDESERFRASLVVLRKILCLGHFSIVFFIVISFSLPLNIFFFYYYYYTLYILRTPHPYLLRFDDRPVVITLNLDDESQNGEDATEIRSEGNSSGFLSSVMKYLFVDSKIPRRSLSSVTRSSEKFVAKIT